MGDWADERAAEWFGSITPAIPAEIRGRFVTLNMPSLAALLREVCAPVVSANADGDPVQTREARTPDDLADSFKALFFCEHTDTDIRAGFNRAADFGREAVLAEVRRVVVTLMGGEPGQLVSGDYILSRLDKL